MTGNRFWCSVQKIKVFPGNVVYIADVALLIHADNWANALYAGIFRKRFLWTQIFAGAPKREHVLGPPLEWRDEPRVV